MAATLDTTVLDSPRKCALNTAGNGVNHFKQRMTDQMCFRKVTLRKDRFFIC